MEVEVKITGRDNIQSNERQTVSVETHNLRGDMYVVGKVDSVLENDSFKTRLRGGDRLVITTPVADDEVVYDAAQGAAVRRSAQVNDKGVADDARMGEQNLKAQQARTEGGGIQARTPDGVRPLSQPGGNPKQPSMRASEANQQANTRVNVPAETPEQKAKREEIEKAKAAQQSGAGRPEGEKPPASGSPVGSPPSGNEGKK